MYWHLSISLEFVFFGKYTTSCVSSLGRSEFLPKTVIVLIDLSFDIQGRPTATKVSHELGLGFFLTFEIMVERRIVKFSQKSLERSMKSEIYQDVKLFCIYYIIKKMFLLEV